MKLSSSVAHSSDELPSELEIEGDKRSTTGMLSSSGMSASLSSSDWSEQG